MAGHDNEPETSDEEPTFGARLLAEYKRLGGTLSPYSWTEIQEIKRCDREGVVRRLRSIGSGISWAAIQRIRSAASPEDLAMEMWRQRQAEATARAMSIWMMLGMLN